MDKLKFKTVKDIHLYIEYVASILLSINQKSLNFH